MRRSYTRQSTKKEHTAHHQSPIELRGHLRLRSYRVSLAALRDIVNSIAFVRRKARWFLFVTMSDATVALWLRRAQSQSRFGRATIAPATSARSAVREN